MTTRTILNGNFVYVAGDKSHVKCVQCDKVYKYHHSTSVLKYHLTNKHGWADHTDVKSQPAVAGSTKQQPTLDEHFIARKVSQTKTITLTNNIVEWVTRDCRPLSIVEDEGLRKLMRNALDNQMYQLPSRKTIVSRIADTFLDKCATLKTLLIAVSFVALTTDGWTSLSNESFMGFTVHFIHEGVRHSKALAVEKMDGRHTAENISEVIAEVMEKWDITAKTIMICTDSASNMINSVKILKINHLPCSAHLLQLSINKAIAASGLDKPLAISRKIVGHFRHSSVQMEALKQKITTKESLVSSI